MYYDKYQAKMLSFKQKHGPYQAKICLEVGKYVICTYIYMLVYSYITSYVCICIHMLVYY